MPIPLLTIGIPTFNHLALLRRAVESALDQDCGDLEILISDNASSDGTPGYCRELAQREPSVRYISHAFNRGPTKNFNTVLREARGEFFLFLSDDDWLDPSYGSRCIAWLDAHSDYAMAGGHPLYLREDGAAATGQPADLPQASPARRVQAYLRDVDDNAAIYGVIPREIVARLTDIRNVSGSDWLFVAEIAALGKLASLPEVRLYRSLGGISASYRSIASALALPAIQGRLPFLSTAVAFANEVLWRSEVHRQMLPRRARLALAVYCAASMARRQIWVEVLGCANQPYTRRPYRAAKSLYHLLVRRTGRGPRLRFPGHSTVVGPAPDKPQNPDSIGLA